MDPTKTLAEIRTLVATADGDSEDFSCLAELVAALDSWIAKGGFLPKQWKQRDD